MKITIIDQNTNQIQQVVPSPEPPHTHEQSFSWFDPYAIEAASQQFHFSEEEQAGISTRIRFMDGREIEVDCTTGELLGV